MTFLNLWAFWLLIPIIMLGLLRHYRNNTSRLPFHPRIVLGISSYRWIRRIELLSLVFMTIALARPVAEHTNTVKAGTYLPVYLAIDLSSSMRATDTKPSRLDYAKKIIFNLLEVDTHHPFGLFGFTTNTLILSPATMDHQLVKTALLSLNPNYIITHGTDLSSLLDTVAKMPEPVKRLVIFSDGGDMHNIKPLVKKCLDNGIVIYSIAVASNTGATIPKLSGGLVRDAKGRLIVSTQNPLMKILAKDTGGESIDTLDFKEAAKEIEGFIDDDNFVSTFAIHTNYIELFWLPLLFGIILYIATIVSFPLNLKRIFIALAALVGFNANAGILDIYHLHKAYDAYEKGDFNLSVKEIHTIAEPTFEREFFLASLYYKEKAYKKSARIFSSLHTKRTLAKEKIYYNLGNCAVKIGRFKSARDFYVKALQLHYDPDAMSNLESIIFLDEKVRKKHGIHANRQVKASGRGDRSQKSKSASKRSSTSSGKGQSGGGGAQNGSKTSRGYSPSSSLKHPIGSKAYELINKGYINERKPW